jgi:aminomethyltransferase
MPLQRTPLFASHQSLGAKLIEFGGWEMPVQYTSIVDEHQCVRRSAGVFDICHMGEVWVEGVGAADFLNATFTNDVRKLSIGGGQYSQMCTESGGTVDDLYVYQVGADRYLLIINASRITDDVAWLQSRWETWGDRANVKRTDVSASTGAIAIQGPKVVGFIDSLFPGSSGGGISGVPASALKKNQIGLWKVDGLEVWVARTGYTGEDGFEVVAPAEIIEKIWVQTLAAGKDSGIQPCGLGARDTLRTEVCYPLYGHELDAQTSPIEAGLGFFVSFDKGPFVGRSVLLQQKESGPSKRLVAFRTTEKSAPPRPGYALFAAGEPIGIVVSGTQSPSLNAGIGLGYVSPAHAAVGTPIAVEIRGKRYAAEVVKKPFYRKS